MSGDTMYKIVGFFVCWGCVIGMIAVSAFMSWWQLWGRDLTKTRTLRVRGRTFSIVMVSTDNGWVVLIWDVDTKKKIYREECANIWKAFRARKDLIKTLREKPHLF